MTLDKKGYMYVAGDYLDTITFPGTSLVDTAALPSYKIFVAKYDTAGNFIWAKGGMNNLTGNFSVPKICYSDSGFVYLVSSFSENASIGPWTFTTASSFYYKDAMVNQEVPWVEIKGGYEERLALAIEAVNKIL
jgi:hypothetical protein